MAQGKQKRGSCLMGLGVALLFTCLFAAVLFLGASLLWDFSPRDLSARQHEGVPQLIFLLSACAGLGGGLLTYALASRKTEE